LDKLEEFFRTLSDGKNWKIEDLAERLGWKEHRVETYCAFISEHELVYYNRTDHSVRIDQGLRKLILQLDRMPSTAL